MRYVGILLACIGKRSGLGCPSCRDEWDTISMQIRTVTLPDPERFCVLERCLSCQLSD